MLRCQPFDPEAALEWQAAHLPLLNAIQKLARTYPVELPRPKNVSEMMATLSDALNYL